MTDHGKVQLSREGKPPAAYSFVFVCPAGDWQVQLNRRAQIQLGGAQAALLAMGEASAEHALEAHPDGRGVSDTLDQLQMEDGNRPDGAMIGMPLPRWWTDW